MNVASLALAGGGKMGAAIRALDWSKTPLGAADDWPQSLLTTVSTCLNCAFPILIGWGPDLVMLYNDEYVPILGSEKPAALGKPGREVWSEIWDVVGPMLTQVMTRGVATRSRDLRLLINRHGYVEETYFSFSYSPIRDESGGIGGVFTPVIETTDRVVGERRLTTLRALAAVGTATTVDAALAAALAVLAAADDCAFAAAYAVDGERVRRIGAPEYELPPTAAAPLIAAAATRAAVQVDGGAALAGVADAARAVVLPVIPAGREAASIVLVAGINPLRPFDADYRAFFDLVAGQIAQAVSDALALEEERRRVEALAELDRAKTQFFANVSHEFRTPLTLLLGPLETLMSRATSDAAARELAATSHRNALRLLKLVNNLLDFSRIEAGRLEAASTPVDLGALTVEIASTFQSLFDRAGVALTIDAAPLPRPVCVDPDHWEKIVLNLVSNAFKFTLAGTVRVVVRAAADGTAAELLIADTGVGIPAAELPRLFDRFHRVEGSLGRSFEGSGIGLALVKELVERQGGAIAVTSREGEGSSFCVRMPFAAAGTRAAAVPPAPDTLRRSKYLSEASAWAAPVPSRPAGAPTAAGSGRVLLADDNPEMRHYVAGLLRAAGLDVSEAADGNAALELASGETFDVIVSDCMMPGLDGLGLLAKVRADPALATVPVILLSARAGEDEKLGGIAAGADDYIAKPFSARELVTRVTTHLALGRQRREATQATERSERRMRLAQHAGRAATWEFEPSSGRFSMAGATDLWGIGPGTPYAAFLDAVHPDDRQTFADMVDRAVASETALDLDFRVVRPDTGEVRWLRSRAELQVGRGERRLIGINIDVTERRAAELALHELNTTLEAEITRRIADRDRLWRLSTDLMLVARFDGTIVDANPAWTTMLGWDKDDLVGRPFQNWVHPDDIAATAGEMESLADGKLTFHFENRYRARSGDYLWFTWTATPDAEFIHAVGRDVTEEKRRAQRLEQAEASLRQMQKMEAIGQLSGGIAHDFNNLLGAMMGSFDLIRRDPANVARVARLAEAGVLSAERGARLTGQLLTFSRAQRIEMRPLDLGALIDGMRELMVRTLGPAIAVRVDVAGDLYAESDQTQLEMALLNLVINARDAMPDGGELTIRASAARLDGDPDLPPGDYAVVTVGDTGTGMPPDVVVRALDPFFTTKGVGKGTGLGLSQAYGLARQSRGTLRITSEPGRGTTVEIVLPRSRSRPDDRASADASGTTAPTAAGVRVLLVDDDGGVRETVGEMLVSLGYAVESVASGPEALRALDDGAPDLLLLDYAMPGMTGAEVAALVRARFGRLPIIFTTGFAETAAIDDVSDANTRVLKKPFRLQDLHAAAVDALARSSPDGGAGPHGAT